MALTRIRPAGWPTTPTTSGGWLTHTDLNALDIDHTNAVDKMNGDTVAGPIVLDGANGGSMEIDGPIVITGAGSTLKTQNGGRIVIYANQLLVPYWPQYSPARAFQRTQPFLVQMSGGLHWLIDNNESVAQFATPGITGNCDITRSLVDGSTLTAIDIFFAVGTSHAAPPAVMPSFALFAKGFNAVDVLEIASGSVPNPGTGAAWFNSGNVQSYTLLVPSYVINRSAENYYVQVVDESGAGAATGNIYQSLRLNYTASDMRPA